MPPDSRSRTSARSLPICVPTVYADERRAWEGPLPDRPDLTVRVEAAALRPSGVFRHHRAVDADPGARSCAPPSLFNRVIGGIATIIMPALMILAARPRAPQRQGRTRRSSAAPSASAPSCSCSACSSLDARHIALSRSSRSKFSASSRRLAARSSMPACCGSPTSGSNPTSAATAPDSILGWTRLLAGHWRDPRVAVDVMIGVSAGLAMTVLFAAHNSCRRCWDIPSPCRLSSSVFDLARPAPHPRRAFPPR